MILEYFPRIYLKKFKFYPNLTRITVPLHEEVRTFMLASRQILLRIKKCSEAIGKIKTNILYPITSSRKSCRWWNVKKCGTDRQVTDDNRTQRMRVAYAMDQVTYTSTEYVKFIALPRQGWLSECASFFYMIPTLHLFFFSILSSVTCLPTNTQELQFWNKIHLGSTFTSPVYWKVYQ